MKKKNNEKYGFKVTKSKTLLLTDAKILVVEKIRHHFCYLTHLD